MHVTLKVDPSLPELRTAELSGVVQTGLHAGKQREGFRLVHYSIQSRHLHLIVEADDARRLSGGIRGLSIRLARGINHALGRRGRVFIDRYHARILTNPRQVRNCLSYVVNNVRRHMAQRGRRAAWNWIDHLSSGPCFEGWSRPPRHVGKATDPPVATPRTWLLASGWKRWGLIDINAIPGDL